MFKYSIAILLIFISLNYPFDLFSQGLGINDTGGPADSSAIVDISSVTMGLLIPRMTTNQRNNIASPAQALLIYNITTKCFEFWEYAAWQTLACAACPVPANISGGYSNATTSQISWHWNTAAGAAGYKFNSANDYATATDNGADTSYTQTDLSCNTPYSLYVWAYNACGYSQVAIFNQTTAACPFICGISSVTFTYKGNTETYGTVLNPTTGECWFDKNLGATNVASSVNDNNAYGDLFQWGRLDDGHQDRNSTTTSTLSTSDIPGHSNFITPNGGPQDWRSPQNGNLWQGAQGINKPCPDGWRIPTETELESERLSWSSNDANGAFASPLKLTSAGFRIGSSGSTNSGARYWSSTISNTYSKHLDFGGNAVIGDDNRGDGLSVRCIKD